MNELPLFSGSGQSEETTWSVERLNAAISGALQDRFPQEIWVRGEIQGLSRTRMRKHWYFELVEKDALGDGVKARLSVALLSWKRTSVDRTITATPGFELDDGIEVRIRGRVDFYPPFGKLQFAMSGIDPAFTLGQLAAQRERVLLALKQEGLLRLNARHAMPMVPQRIGLVTSVGSAAYNDFVNELQQGGFGYRIEVVDARVQGADAEKTLLAALAALSRRPVDVVAIVRGGGSRSDLAAFDVETLARAIAKMSVPVITGIGHEIDTSVADMVAHTAYKTPTACAAALVQRTAEFIETLDALSDRVSRTVLERVDSENRGLVGEAHRIAALANGHLKGASRYLEAVRARLRREAPRMVEHRRRTLLSLGGELRAMGRLSLLRREQGLLSARQALTMARLDPMLARRADEFRLKTRFLAKQPLKRIEREELRLDGVAARVRALDPSQVLARGYSISRDEYGHLVRSIFDLKPSDVLITSYMDGALRSRVEDRIEKQEPGRSS